jgi:two-component system chemotaxis response regulator CheB
MSRASPERPVTVLVVDDSALVRAALREIIEADPSFHVTLAGDPYEAVAQMSKLAPAAIVLDIDMPRMDGLTFLRKLMRQHPLPVLLCTDHPERGLTGLELGARELIAKPDWEDAEGLAAWGERLREGLRSAIGLEPARGGPHRMAEPRHSADVVLPPRVFSPQGAPAERIIVVGASTGGVQAIARLLAELPRDTPALVIVQHMPATFTAAFAERLDRDPKIALEVLEARSGEVLRSGLALIVPGNRHGLVCRSGSGYRVELVEGPLVSRHRPSVDVLFRSTAQAAGPRAIGILLTGMGDDGAQGLLELREAGAWTIAQDEATCVVFGMPGEAVRRGAARHVLALDRVASFVSAWAHA